MTYIFPDKLTIPLQVQKIEEAIAAQADGIAVCAFAKDEAYEEVAGLAREAGIAFGSAAAPPAGSQVRDPNDIFLFRTGSDERAAGALTAQRLIAMGVKGRVVVGDQQPGDATCRDRADAQIEVLKAAGIEAEFLELTLDPGQQSEAIFNYLRRYPETEAATSVCDVIDGFLSAKAESGRDDLILTGYDIVAQSLEAIRDGRQAFTIDQQQFWRGYMPVLLLTHQVKYGLLQANYFLTGTDHRRQVERGAGRHPGGAGLSLIPRRAARAAGQSAGERPVRSPAGIEVPCRSATAREMERGRIGSGGSLRVIYGEAARRFMLRPEATALAAAVFLFAVFTILSPKLFPTTLTYVSVMSVAAELGIVSIGVTLLMIGGHFDLSVGAVLGLASFACVTLMRDFGMPPYVAAPAAVLVGACLGAVNGAIVVRFRIHSFVVTLGTMLIWRGVTIALTGGFPMTVPIPPEFKALMSGKLLGGFRMSMLWFFIIGLMGTFLLVRTKFGNWIQARGQNEQAARNLGVPVDRVTLLLFMISSSLAAVAGVIQVARFSSVDALRGGGHRAPGGGCHRHRRHPPFRWFRERHRHHSRGHHVRHDPGRAGARGRARALLPHPDRPHRRRGGHPEHGRRPAARALQTARRLPEKQRGGGRGHRRGRRRER